MIVWPESLLAEVAERRCVVVLGAGASTACESADGKHPADWDAFLKNGIDRITVAADKVEATSLINDKRYLDAAEILVEALGPADFAKFLTDELVEPDFQHCRLHELIVRIDPKIVLTTNYDDIFESFARQGAAAAGYNVCNYYETHLINDLRSPRRVIMKVHGSVTDPQRVVLTRRQYFAARRNYSQFYGVVDAIVLTSTLLFIGAGFADPDIQLMLENAHISAPSDHPHYAVVESGRHHIVRHALETTHNVKLLEYTAGEHQLVEEALASLADSVDAYRAVGGT